MYHQIIKQTREKLIEKSYFGRQTTLNYYIYDIISNSSAGGKLLGHFKMCKKDAKLKNNLKVNHVKVKTCRFNTLVRDIRFKDKYNDVC